MKKQKQNINILPLFITTWFLAIPSLFSLFILIASFNNFLDLSSLYLAITSSGLLLVVFPAIALAIHSLIGIWVAKRSIGAGKSGNGLMRINFAIIIFVIIATLLMFVSGGWAIFPLATFGSIALIVLTVTSIILSLKLVFELENR